MDKNQSHSERALDVLYIGLAIFWASFIPLTVMIVTPDILKFLGDLGRYSAEELHREYALLMGCAAALLVGNTLFVTWHFWIKRKKSHLLKNRYFFTLSVVGSLALAWKFLSVVFIPQI